MGIRMLLGARVLSPADLRLLVEAFGKERKKIWLCSSV